MSKPLLLIATFCLCLGVYGQKKEAFSQLNLPLDELFLPASNTQEAIADGCSITCENDRQKEAAWLGALNRSMLDGTQKFPSYTEMNLSIMKEKANDFTERLVFIHSSYLDVTDKSFIETDGDGYLHASSDYPAWTQSKNAFFFYTSATEEQNAYRFIIDPQYFFSDEPISMYTIDLHNEKGEQPLEFNHEYNYTNGLTIHYNGPTALNFSIGSKEVKSVLAGKSGDYIDPSPSPWPEIDAFFPYTQFITKNGEILNFNMYPLLSADGVFNEPVLFFEGIDFGTSNEPLRNGTFGWPEFITGGVGTNYSFLSNFPILVDSLRNAGKDIVLVDFWDGATYIEDNTDLAKKAIKLCNEYKVGNVPLICVGTSMGGVIARKALREMELDANQEHCTSLFISHDSPHSGANIPIGLQALVSFMSDPISQAQQIQEQTLLRPAARQLLVRQYHPYTNWHYNFQASLDQLGFPEECKMIAVNNGNKHGMKLDGIEAGQHLLDYNCSQNLFDDLLVLEVLSLPGSANHEDAISPGSVLAKFRMVKTFLQSGCNSPLCVWDENFQINTGQIPNWDNMPGGARTSVFDLVSLLNQSLSGNQDCPLIGSDNYFARHSFIPSYSALGMDLSYAYSDLESELMQNPDLSPFDDFHSPEIGNEEHSFLSLSAIDFLWPHISSSSNTLSGEVTATGSPNGGVFNFGKDGYNLLGDVDISDGGSLLINHGLETHWAEDSDEITEQGHFTVHTSPCSSQIRIGTGGLLHIGSESVDQSGELILRSGTVLQIEENGRLIIDKYSTLRIEEGAEIHAEPGSILILEEGAQLLVESGSALYVNSPLIQLKHETAMIDFEGELVLEASSTLELQPTNGQMGYLRFSQAGIRLWGSACRLEIEGVDNDQKLIEIAEGAQFWNSDDFHKVSIEHGLIDFKSGAQMPMSCSFTARDCTFKGTDADDHLGIHVFKRNNFYDCQFQNCSLAADLFFYNEAKLRVTDSYFTGSNTKVRVNGMGYSIVGCDFAGTRGIHSQDMSEPSVLFRSRINSSDPFSNQFRGVFDDSDVELQIRKCGIHACGEYGVLKLRGMLTLNCTEITQNKTGVGIEWALLNMARGFGGGDNVLSNNETNLLLDFALGVNINYGYNEFSDPINMNIDGSVMGSCDATCSNGGQFVCANNTWLMDDEEIGPDPEFNSIYKIDQCDGIGTYEFCESSFYTFSQFAPPTCPNRITRNPWKYASYLSGQNGDSVFQDYVYRISKAAGRLSINNEEGSDEDVVIELAALVQSGAFVDMQEDDQFWSLMLKQIMKTAIQTLDDDIQISSSVFTPLEAQYVEVLNYFDDHYQAWSKADYRLAHEQTKASFFHSRGDAFTSKQILDKAGECGLDLKLQEINSRIKCQLIEEMALKDLGLHSIISNQSMDLNIENDPISLNPGVAQNCFIASASDVQFGICGTPPLLNTNLESVGVYPNPNDGNFKVILEDFQTCSEIRIWNSVGQLIQTIPASDEVIINLNLSLQKGIYLIEFRGEDKSITEKLVVH